MKDLIAQVDFNKSDGLVPAIVQDHLDGTVLMLGWMNAEALSLTLSTGLVTFFSRTKNRIWQKGESSGNLLRLKDILLDCDSDSLLIRAKAEGSTCHTGARSCFGDSGVANITSELEQTIDQRRGDMNQSSYTASLFSQGPGRIAQKVGEEGVEVVVAAMSQDNEKLLEESADLLFHLLVLLRSKSLSFGDVLYVLEGRRAGPQSQT